MKRNILRKIKLHMKTVYENSNVHISMFVEKTAARKFKSIQTLSRKCLNLLIVKT